MTMKTKRMTHHPKRHFVFLIVTLICYGLLAATSVSLAAGTWKKKADMPTPRAVFGAGVIDGVIYVSGGSRAWGHVYVGPVEAYNANN